MSELYPVFLNVANRPCLVVGGGAVAARKLRGLLEAGARVTVVAPRRVDALAEAAAAGDVTWIPRAFEAGDLDGMVLAFVATSDREVNRWAAREARARGVWVNVADDPEACDFALPAVLRRGRAAVAVSTGGASPAMASWLRDRVSDSLPESIALLVEVARHLRGGARQTGGEPFRELFSSGILEDLSAGDWEAADRKVARFFGPTPGVRELLGGRVREAT